MSPFWVKLILLLLSLGLLVFIHEFGHFSFARLFHVWVERFYLFFHPRFQIMRWKPSKHKVEFLVPNEGDEPAPASTDEPTPEEVKEKQSWRATTYGIGWLPLGGYCQMSGMIDESMDLEAMKRPAKPWEFRSKPAWQRLLIMVGGVFFNFLTALVIYAGIVYTQGEAFVNYSDAVEGMRFGPTALQAGFQDGDIMLSADGEALTYLSGESLSNILMAKQVTVLRNHADTVTITLPDDFLLRVNKDIEAGDIFMTYRLPVYIGQLSPGMGAEKAGLQVGDHVTAVAGVPTPAFEELTAALNNVKGQDAMVRYERDGKVDSLVAHIDEDGKLGIGLLSPEKVYNVTKKEYSLLEAIPRGITLGWTTMINYVKQLKYIFTPQGAKSVGGFGTIGSIFPDTFDWVEFWNITALLSLILAVMNILPIPALDGGHVLFLLVELLSFGKIKPSDKFLEYAQWVGMFLLLALLVWANGNDIYRFLIK